MRRDVKIVVAGLVLLPGTLAASASHSRAQLPDNLPARESGDFALAAERALLEPAYRHRGLGLDFEGELPNSHFYQWSVIPSWGQGVEHYAVDRRTGDVWANLGCERVRSRELAALQARFRRRFHVSASQVREIEREGFPGTGCP